MIDMGGARTLIVQSTYFQIGNNTPSDRTDCGMELAGGNLKFEIVAECVACEEFPAQRRSCQNATETMSRFRLTKPDKSFNPGCPLRQISTMSRP